MVGRRQRDRAGARAPASGRGIKPIAIAIGIATIAGGAFIFPSGANTVDEEIVTAEPDGGGGAAAGAPERGGDEGAESERDVELAGGPFEGVSGHGGAGDATVVELAEVHDADRAGTPGVGGAWLRPPAG